jgi:hypothetical protein
MAIMAKIFELAVKTGFATKLKKKKQNLVKIKMAPKTENIIFAAKRPVFNKFK